MSEKKHREFQQTSGREIFHWPEFQALAKRLNIDTSLPIQNLSIKLPAHNIAVIKLRYSGEDAQKIHVESESP